ncbi:hypothetical protein F183_A29470 [Bryobacterales bacterium F-183]|nr:hypothetical protein F183_A29470 [Bryobacterales bacterium F-183]
MKHRFFFTFVVCLGAAFGQEDDSKGTGSTAAAAPGSFQTQTAKDRWNKYAKDAFLSPAPFFASVMPALGQQNRNEPVEYGQGWDAFGNRVGRRAAQYQLQTAIYHAGAAAMGTSTGYQRCACSGGAKRLGYALSRSFVTKNSSGATVPNAAFLGGIVGGAVIASEAWYPARYRWSGEGMQTATVQVGVGTAFNIIQEFGPDLKKLFRRK